MERLKIQVEKDPVVRKKLEEYMTNLVEEYMEKRDFRRTKLYRKIEEIYSDFPQNQSIAEDYAECFALLNIYAKKVNEVAVKTMSAIWKQFPDSESISHNYACLLSWYSKNLDLKKCEESANIVEKLCARFPDEEYLKEFLEEIQDNYEIAAERERLFSYIRLLDQRLSEDESSEKLIAEYVNALAEYASYVGEKDCAEIIRIVSEYCEQFPDNMEYKRKYAEIKVCLMRQTDEKNAIRSLIEIKHLYFADPSIEMAVIYSAAIDICIRGYEYTRALWDAKWLNMKHPENPQIAFVFAKGLEYTIDTQEQADAVRTLEELSSLAKKWPDNEEIQTCFKSTKQSLISRFKDTGFRDYLNARDTETICEETTVNRDCFAVLDTETTWDNKVMTIGVVIADRQTYEPEKFRYYVISPDYLKGGMYSGVVPLQSENVAEICSREEAIQNLCDCFNMHGVDSIYAYNMSFDRSKLPELQGYFWFDIMAIAANKRYNKSIPCDVDCYQSGRMKRGYGAEAILRMLSGNCDYKETHNALFDAMDELKIMQYLRYTLKSYVTGSEPVENPMCVCPSDKKENEYKKGDRIYHSAFGHGLILSSMPAVNNSGGCFIAKTVFLRGDTKKVIAPYSQLVKKEI